MLATFPSSLISIDTFLIISSSSPEAVEALCGGRFLYFGFKALNAPSVMTLISAPLSSKKERVVQVN